MYFQQLLKLVKTPNAGQHQRRVNRTPRLRVEMLEERSMFAFTGLQTYGAELALSTALSADFNGDGRADMVAANVNSLGVLLGNGNGTFQPAITSAAGYNTKSLQAADLNADGKIDLVTVSDNYGLDVRLGNGDGTFQQPQSLGLPWQLTSYYYDLPYPVAQTPESIAVGDLDADGRQDLIVGGMTAYTVYYNDEGVDYVYESFVNVLLGNGDGTFRLGSVKNNPGGSLDQEVGDFNNDGRVDVVSDGGGVLLGNGDGTLRDLVYSGVRTYFTSNPVNDFNRDGKLDLLSGANLYLGNGDGSFQPVRQLDPSWSPYSTAGDVNADGNLDIVLMKSQVTHFGEEYIYDSITARTAEVLLGNGNGAFAEPIVVNFGTVHGISNFTSAALADFDGNGSPDLAATESFAVDVYTTPINRGISVALNDGVWAAPPPSVSVSDVIVTEGNSGTRVANLTVTLSAASSNLARVAFATTNGTAIAGSDYQSALGVVTFLAGEITKNIAVVVTGDRLAEANETFLVNLSNPTNATIADGQGVGTILDDEPRINISNVSKAEGKKNQTTLFTFTVTLSAAYDQPVTISFRTVDGQAMTGDQDYVGKTGKLTFAPGETSKTITIEVKGDNKKESNEAFYVDLFGNSSNSQLIKNRGVGTILNDD